MTKQKWIAMSMTVVMGVLPVMALASSIPSAFEGQPSVALAQPGGQAAASTTLKKVVVAQEHTRKSVVSQIPNVN